MITVQGAYYLGFLHTNYSIAWLDNNRFNGNVSPDIAIYLKKEVLINGKTEIQGGVKYRVDKPVATWWPIETIDDSEFDAVIDEIKAFNNEDNHYPFFVVTSE